jgi:hypothetical protein
MPILYQPTIRLTVSPAPATFDRRRAIFDSEGYGSAFELLVLALRIPAERFDDVDDVTLHPLDGPLESGFAFLEPGDLCFGKRRLAFEMERRDN